jgi:hypothetical protein
VLPELFPMKSLGICVFQERAGLPSRLNSFDNRSGTLGSLSIFLHSFVGCLSVTFYFVDLM